MGIKDWFSGDKKKAAYRDKLKEAVADGKLDTEEMKSLEELRKDLDVSDVAGDRTIIRRQIYNEAVGAVRRDGEYTHADAAELAKIQKFLALRDNQVEQTKWDLARLRVLTEIREGHLPTVSEANVALRGVQLEAEEVAHYSVSVEIFQLGSTRGADGVQLVWGKPYDGGSARAHVLPEAGAKPLGEGSLIITNRRLILKTGTRIATVKYAPEAQIHLYGDGVRLQRTAGNTLLKFRSGSEETGEIVGELLSALMK